MPEPEAGEDKDKFISRCIEVVMNEGTAKDTEQAAAICYSKWEDAQKALAEGGRLVDSVKIGRRNNSKDQERLQTIHDYARDNGATCYGIPLLELKSKSIKSDGNYILLNIASVETGAIKAVGDWELEVLGVPFGGPLSGKDTDGQYFSRNTVTRNDIMPEIPVFYYHGMRPDKHGQQEFPELIGRAKFERVDSKGHWYRVILDKASAFAKRIWEAAKNGIARASSGSLQHLVRVARDGEIIHWPVAEMSLIDATEGRAPANAYAVAMPVMKSDYKLANMVIPPDLGDNNEQPVQPEGESEAVQTADSEGDGGAKSKKENNNMDEIQEKVQAAVAEALKVQREAEEKAKKDAQEREAAIKAEAEKRVEEYKAEAAKNRRLPEGAPYVAKFADTNKFDNLDAADTAVMVAVLQSAKAPVSEGAIKSLAFKLEEDKGEVGRVGQRAMKAAGIKANEIEYSTLSTYGDEWIGVAYSTALWEAIRLGTFVVGKLPTVEVPQGFESIYLPLESTDPTWYKVAEATSSATGYAGPTPTVTASLLSTGRVQMTLAKLGARVVWTGEMEEGSLIPFAGQLRQQLAVSGAEYLESALIDGDTETGASTNINDIDGTPTATDWFLVWNGFRKSPLVTTTANSRSAAGSLDVTDYLETIKLMGTGGKNAIDTSKVGFIVDPLTYYKTMSLPEVLTRDVFVSPTLEGGKLSGLWGYGLNVSGQMCKNGGNGLSEATGKVDETTGDNAYGQILAVRWDQWKFGWRRRMTMETQRWAASDSTEIVAQIRCGLIQRDTEAAAITYYVGV